MRIPLLFILLLPLAEIAGFVLVGRAIGVLATLGLTVGTGILGLYLLRRQGFSLLERLGETSRNGTDPGRELVHGAMIVIAAFLLLLPGFITDVLGLLLFLPFMRDLAWSLVQSRMVYFSSTTAYRETRRSDGPATEPGRSGPVVDLETDEYRRDPKSSSPWSSNTSLPEE